jgi:uncharacterized protein (DUF1015 family)
MANIHPFKGVRYNKAKVGDLNDVVSPPYDVISPQERGEYCGVHPNNIVRLILPAEPADGRSKYDYAASLLNEWLESGVLAREDEPSIYACEQEYEIFGVRKKRLGFTCLVRIADYEQRTVLPHENVLAKPLDDRLNLLRATKTNFDSVFGLYPNGKIEEILKPFLLREPDARATDKAGVTCNLWKISDKNAIKALSEAMTSESVLIADGHHRYAAALAYRDEMRAKNGSADPDAPYEFVMMTLVSLENEGLVVLPTHRLVKDIENFDPSAFLGRLSEFFDITETDEDLEKAIESSDPTEHVFGLRMAGGISKVIRLKPGVRPEEVIEGSGSDALKRLDVSILHSLILEKILGIGAQRLSAQSNLAYKRDASQAVEAVDGGEFQMAFLMNATRVDEVKDVAAAGDKMPQKSTFFYPKLLTGLVSRVM